MEVGGFPVLAWLIPLAVVLYASYLLFILLHHLEIVYWNLFPPRKGSSYHKDNTWIANHDIPVRVFLFVVTLVVAIRFVNEISASP